MIAKNHKNEPDSRFRSEEELLLSQFRDIPVPIWLYDEKTLAFLGVNRAASEKYGYSKSEFLKMVVTDIYFRGRSRGARTGAARSGTKTSRRSRLKTKDGNIVSADVRSHRLRIAGRGVILNVVVEVPARENDPAPFAEDERLYRRLFEQSPTPMLIYQSRDLKILTVNDAFVSKYGYSRKEAAGLYLADLYAETDGKRVAALVKKLKQRSYEDVAESVKKDGTRITVEVRSYAVTYNRHTARAMAVHDISKRKLVEEALLESEGRLGRAESVAHMGFLDWDLKTNRIYLSDEACRIHGIERQEEFLTPDLVARAVHPDDIASVSRNLEQAIGGTKPYDIDHRVIRPDGTIRWVHAQALLSRNSEGEPDRLLGTVVDITERKRAEEASKESEEQYRKLVTLLPDALFVNFDGKIVLANPACCRLLGAADPSELIGKSIFEIVHPEYHESVRERRRVTLAGGSAPLTEEKYVRLDGSVVEVDVVSAGMEWKGARGTQVIVRETTERKKAERELRESQERYRRLFEDHTAVKLIIDPISGAILDANEAAARFYGWPRGELKKRTIRDINVMPPDQLKVVLEKAASEIVDHFEFRHRLADGSMRDVEVFSSRIEIHGKPILESIVHDITDRKQAEEALRESEQRYRRLIRFLSDPVYVHVDSRVAFVNDAMCRLLGADDPSQLLGKSVFEIIHPDFHEIVRQRLQVVFGGRPAQLLEEKFVRLDGTSVEVEVSAVAVEWEGTVGVQVMARDITERKEAEGRLRVSDEVIKRVNSLILIADSHGKITYVSPSVKTILGYDPEEVLGDGWWRLTQTTNPDQERSVAAAAKGDIPVAEAAYETKVQAKDGKIHWILWQDARGVGKELIGVGQDITDRKHAEEALVLSERKYKDIFESAPMGIYQSTLDGRFITCNSELAKILGYTSPEDMIGLDIANDVYYEKGERDALIAQYEPPGSVTDLEIRWKRKDGSRVWIQLNSRAIKDTNGKTLGFEGFVRDVNEKKEAEEQLRQNEARRRELELELIQAQKLESLGTLASGVAHDFNNLLGVIIGHATLLDRFLGDREAAYKKNIDAVLKASTRGAGLVKQMLTFARKTDVVIESVVLNDLVNEIVRFIRETFSKTIAVETHLDPDLPPIDADITQVHQVLLNLCVNARDAMPDGGKLVISTSKENRPERLSRHPKATAKAYVVLTVSDTGIGMSEETQLRIFEPFFTTKGHGKGTGLGMSLVFGIMESHKGFITVRSKPGKGSTFCCYFPLPDKDLPASFSAKADVEDLPGGSETILAVEDEELLRELLAEILSPKGYTLLLAEDGEEGLAIYEERRKEIRLVISDFGLPKFAGDEFYRRLKEFDPDVRFILSSGYMEPGTKVALLREGVMGFMPKPYKPAEVLQIVRQILDGK